MVASCQLSKSPNWSSWSSWLSRHLPWSFIWLGLSYILITIACTIVGVVLILIRDKLVSVVNIQFYVLARSLEKRKSQTTPNHQFMHCDFTSGEVIPEQKYPSTVTCVQTSTHRPEWSIQYFVSIESIVEKKGEKIFVKLPYLKS